MDALKLAQKARSSSLALQSATTQQKNDVLQTLHRLLLERKEQVLEANRRDLEEAEARISAGTLNRSTFQRLDLHGNKFASLVAGVLDVMRMPDPCEEITMATQLDAQLELYRVRCPVGVLLVIFEARPEVLIQITCLALKSGNAVILKGGKEASATLEALYAVVRDALRAVGDSAGGAVPEDAVQLLFSREEVPPLLKLDRYIDLVIPRGSKELVRQIQESTRIPVLGHADGLCSIYVHEDALVSKSVAVIVDAKTDYPAACNSVETLLVHRSIAHNLLPPLFEALGAKSVQLRVTKEIHDSHCSNYPALQLATDADFDTEFVDLILAVRLVDSVEEAMVHINEHGSRHTDCILTESKPVADAFMRRVDSAGVYWNASTRFADGHRYGFGAEIGVSTNKTHARGPVGLEGLMIYKYRLVGNGHCASWFAANGTHQFLHKPINIPPPHQQQ